MHSMTLTSWVGNMDVISATDGTYRGTLLGRGVRCSIHTVSKDMVEEVTEVCL